VHVEHCDGFVEWKEWMVHVVGASQKSAFFATEGNEYNSARQLFFPHCQPTRHFQERYRSRPVIIGTVVNLIAAGRQRTRPPVTHMIVLRNDDDRLVCSRPHSLQYRNYILGL